MKTISKFSLRIPDEAKIEIKNIAKKKGYPMNTLLLQWIWKNIEEERGK